MKILTTLITMRRFTGNLHLKMPVFAACLVLVMSSFLPPIQVSALPQTHKDAIDRNSPHYFLELASNGSTTCNAETVGNNPENAAYIWNFFAEKELTPIAIAGIMGNFSEETGGTFDPAIKQDNSIGAIPDNGDGTTGYGIAQWTYQSRQAGLFRKMRAAGLGEYYGAGWGNPEINKTEMSREDIEKLLDVELTYAWEQDSTKIKNLATALNATTSVGGNSGSTIIFHNRYEGSADDASQLQERVTSAERILAEFGGGACSEHLGGVGVMEDAIPWAMKFVEDTRAEYPDAPQARATVVENPQPEGNMMQLAVWPESTSFICWRTYGCDECTTLSSWFVTKMTNYTYGGGNGGEVVANMRGTGVPTGSEPKPFSVFSTFAVGGQYGHTGVILGVLENGNVIALENNNGANTLKVFVYDIKATYPDVTFAYVGDKLKSEGMRGE